MKTDSNSISTKRSGRGVLTAGVIAVFLSAGVAAAVAAASTGILQGELDPEVQATLDALSQQEAEAMKNCPVFGQQITDKYLASIGLETPKLPHGLADSATARSVHCRVTQGRVVQLQIDITGPDEPYEMWSSIFIGPAGNPVEGHGAEQILDIAESEILPQIQQDKPTLVRHQIGDNSLLAIDPRSNLAAHADESHSASIGRLTTRWSK
jgi:hypothetical protein